MQWYKVTYNKESSRNGKTVENRFQKANSIEDAKKRVTDDINKETYSHKSVEDTIVSIEESPLVSFREVIPQFIHKPNYCVDVSWDYLEDTLSRYKDVYDLDTDPDFQRGHVWTEEQQIAYVEYAMSGGMSGREVFFNAANWQGNGEVGQMQLVDGKQRITAVLRFLRGEIKVFGKYVASDFQYLPNSNCGFKFGINGLKTRAEVLRWYLQYNGAGTPHTKEELDKVRKMLDDEK